MRMHSAFADLGYFSLVWGYFQIFLTCKHLVDMSTRSTWSTGFTVFFLVWGYFQISLTCKHLVDMSTRSTWSTGFTVFTKSTKFAISTRLIRSTRILKNICNVCKVCRIHHITHCQVYLVCGVYFVYHIYNFKVFYFYKVYQIYWACLIQSYIYCVQKRPFGAFSPWTSMLVVRWFLLLSLQFIWDCIYQVFGVL